MKVIISTAGPDDEVAIHIMAESVVELGVIKALGRMNHQSASLYVETEAAVYGISEREDGQVLIGPSGEPPTVTINLF